MNENLPMYIIAAITFIVNIPYLFGIAVSDTLFRIIGIIDIVLILCIVFITIKGHRNKK